MVQIIFNFLSGISLFRVYKTVYKVAKEGGLSPPPPTLDLPLPHITINYGTDLYSYFPFSGNEATTTHFNDGLTLRSTNLTYFSHRFVIV
jgi:hypothetical protein